MCHTFFGGVTKDVTLKARVDDALAEQVDRWAEEHETDRSGTIRIALRRLLEAEEERQRRLDAVRERFDVYAEAGAFEPPEDDDWKASGGWS